MPGNSTNNAEAPDTPRGRCALSNKIPQPYFLRQSHAQRACHSQAPSSAVLIHPTVLKPFNPLFAPWPATLKELDVLNIFRASQLINQSSSAQSSQVQTHERCCTPSRSFTPSGQGIDSPCALLAPVVLPPSPRNTNFQKDHRSSSQASQISISTHWDAQSRPPSISVPRSAHHTSKKRRLQVTSCNCKFGEDTAPSPWTAQPCRPPPAAPHTPATFVACMFAARCTHAAEREAVVEMAQSYEPLVYLECEDSAVGPHRSGQGTSATLARCTASDPAMPDRDVKDQLDAVKTDRCSCKLANSPCAEERALSDNGAQGTTVSPIPLRAGFSTGKLGKCEAGGTRRGSIGSLGDKRYNGAVRSQPRRRQRRLPGKLREMHGMKQVTSALHREALEHTLQECAELATGGRMTDAGIAYEEQQKQGTSEQHNPSEIPKLPGRGLRRHTAGSCTQLRVEGASAAQQQSGGSTIQAMFKQTNRTAAARPHTAPERPKKPLLLTRHSHSKWQEGDLHPTHTAHCSRTVSMNGVCDASGSQGLAPPKSSHVHRHRHTEPSRRIHTLKIKTYCGAAQALCSPEIGPLLATDHGRCLQSSSRSSARAALHHAGAGACITSSQHTWHAGYHSPAAQLLQDTASNEDGSMLCQHMPQISRFPCSAAPSSAIAALQHRGLEVPSGAKIQSNEDRHACLKRSVTALPHLI
jgi:hypothetical protein